MNNTEAFELAIRILSYRAYSEQEIRERLAMRGYDRLVIDTTISYLINQGYLNDHHLAQALVNRFQQKGKYSIKTISAKLKKRGLNTEVVLEAVGQIDLDSELTTALKLVNHRYKELATLDYPKVARFLANRGFSAITISKALERLFNDT